MSKHTPGPWEIEEREGGGYTVKHKLEGAIVYVTDQPIPELRDAEKLEANARLIAAAPDLLDALIVALAALEIFDLVRQGEKASYFQYSEFPSTREVRDLLNRMTSCQPLHLGPHLVTGILDRCRAAIAKALKGGDDD